MNTDNLCSDGGIKDFNYLRYPGWEESNTCIKYLYSPEVRQTISRKVSELTMGVDKKNRKIVVADKIICMVLDSVYQNFTPPVGDIFTRYIIPNDNQPYYTQSIIDQTIEIITSQVRNMIGMQDANEKLSIWNTVLGDFNEHQLRSHPPIKLQEKRPSTMQFNMRY